MRYHRIIFSTLTSPEILSYMLRLDNFCLKSWIVLEWSKSNNKNSWTCNGSNAVVSSFLVVVISMVSVVVVMMVVVVEGVVVVLFSVKTNKQLIHSCGQWTYSVTQLPVEFQWHWHVTNAKISIIRTTNIHFLMNLVIKMINLIGVIPYMTVMTDISAFDMCQCHWNSTGNWVTE